MPEISQGELPEHHAMRAALQASTGLQDDFHCRVADAVSGEIHLHPGTPGPRRNPRGFEDSIAIPFSGSRADAPPTR